MLVQLNLILFLKLFLPPLIYIMILYLTAPNKTLNLKIAALCFFGGILSTNLVQLYYAMVDIVATSPFELQFFSVAPREELCKLLAFGGAMLAVRKQSIHPVATMFYMGIVGLGFATFENFMYGIIYGESIVLPRAITATLGHLIFGLFLGYWMGLGKIDLGKYGNRSLFGFYMYKYKKLKMGVYALIGLITAISFHGLWNYNLTVSWVASAPIMILMIIFGLSISKFGATDLNNHYRKSLKKL